MNNYEKKVKYNLYFVDSGTIDRLYFVELYSIIQHVFYIFTWEICIIFRR